MGSLLSGYRGTLLEIKCEDEFKVIFAGNISDKKAVSLKINENIESELFIQGEYKDRVVVKTTTSNGELTVNSGNVMRPSFFENGVYQVAIENKSQEKIYLSHMEIPLDKSFQEIGNVSLGTVEFSSDVGYSTFNIIKDKEIILSFTIEVFPSKIDYLKDYKALIREVNEEITSLAFKFMDKTYLKTDLVNTEFQSNSEFLNILKVIFEDIEKALKRVEQHPKHVMETHEVIVPSYKAKRVSNKTLNYIRKHPGVLVEDNRGKININGVSYTSTKVIESQKKTTIDIYENRFVKDIIVSIIRRLDKIRDIIIKSKLEDNHWISFIDNKTRILKQHLNNYFRDIGNLTGKKSMSLVFQMAPGYKEIYKKYVLLKKGLDLGNSLYQMTPKKIYSLYESWCYIKLHRILCDLGYHVKEHGIIKFNDNGLYFSFIQNEEAKMVYDNDENKIELWYQKYYGNLPTTKQIPDTVLCIRKLGDKENRRMYIFDAKYRVATDNYEIGPMEDDINVMHRYRDSIVSQLDNKVQFKYDSFGAYVMFPYGDEEKFKNHRFYKSIESVNIGAFPMLPGSTNLIKDFIKKIINETDIEARNNRIVLDEYDNYSKFKNENVMVVNVKDEDHFNKYKENLFYHIPTKQLNNIKPGVEYIAFYQSNKSFNDDGGIRYYGKIKDTIKYKRKECLEIPCESSKAENEYLRINMESIQEITRIKPIQAGTRLLSYTTLYLLLNARNMHELKFKNSLEVKVYSELQKICGAKEYSITKKYGCYNVNGVRVEIVDGKRILVDGVDKVDKIAIRVEDLSLFIS